MGAPLVSLIRPARFWFVPRDPDHGRRLTFIKYCHKVRAHGKTANECAAAQRSSGAKHRQWAMDLLAGPNWLYSCITVHI